MLLNLKRFAFKAERFCQHANPEWVEVVLRMVGRKLKALT